MILADLRNESSEEEKKIPKKYKFFASTSNYWNNKWLEFERTKVYVAFRIESKTAKIVLNHVNPVDGSLLLLLMYAWAIIFRKPQIVLSTYNLWVFTVLLIISLPLRNENDDDGKCISL